MEGKKNAGRFTVQFNLNDPIHLLASTILEKQGRHKAQYISNAISYYQYHIDCVEQAQAKYVNTEKSVRRKDDLLRKPFSSLKHATTTQREQVVQSKYGRGNDSDEPLDELFEDSELPEIQDTLAAFCQQK